MKLVNHNIIFFFYSLARVCVVDLVNNFVRFSEHRFPKTYCCVRSSRCAILLPLGIFFPLWFFGGHGSGEAPGPEAGGVGSAFTRQGGHAGQGGQQPCVYVHPTEEHGLVQPLVVVVQQHRCAVHGGEAQSRDPRRAEIAAVGGGGEDLRLQSEVHVLADPAEGCPPGV